MRSGEIKDVKVKGLAADSGVEMTIALLNNVEDFGRYDYNSLTKGLTVDFNGFARSAILSLLRQVAEEHDYMIGATNAG